MSEKHASEKENGKIRCTILPFFIFILKLHTLHKPSKIYIIKDCRSCSRSSKAYCPIAYDLVLSSVSVEGHHYNEIKAADEAQDVTIQKNAAVESQHYSEVKSEIQTVTAKQAQHYNKIKAADEAQYATIQNNAALESQHYNEVKSAIQTTTANLAKATAPIPSITSESAWCSTTSNGYYNGYTLCEGESFSRPGWSGSYVNSCTCDVNTETTLSCKCGQKSSTCYASKCPGKSVWNNQDKLVCEDGGSCDGAGTFSNVESCIDFCSSSGFYSPQTGVCSCMGASTKSMVYQSSHSCSGDVKNDRVIGFQKVS